MSMGFFDGPPGSAVLRGQGGYLVYCAGVRWNSVPGTDRRLVSRLKRHVPVLWVDPPESVLVPAQNRQGAKIGQAMMDMIDGRLVRLTVGAPPLVTRPISRDVAGAMLRRALRRTVSQIGGEPRALIASTPDERFVALPGVRRVYYATDDFSSGAKLMGVSPRRIARADKRRAAAADVLVAITEPIAARWEGMSKPVVLLPNGCEPALFNGVDGLPKPSDVRLEGPVAGVVGQISSRIDGGLLAAVADSGTSVLLIGPLSPTAPPDWFAGLVRRPNVQWVGAKDYDQLPAYFGALDVGLTPYADTAFNRASFPLKTLEYLSAGRGVVSTPSPAVDWLGTGLIRTARSPQDFVDAVREELLRCHSETLRDQRRAFAEGHSWESRAVQLLGVLGLDEECDGTEDGPS